MCAYGSIAEVPPSRRMAERQETEDREGAIEATKATHHKVINAT